MDKNMAMKWKLFFGIQSINDGEPNRKEHGHDMEMTWKPEGFFLTPCSEFLGIRKVWGIRVPGSWVKFYISFQEGRWVVGKRCSGQMG